ncbi:MAG: heparinase II/III family protein [Lachnospiraceae bacterium]
MRKKILSFALALSLVFSSVPLTVYGQVEEPTKETTTVVDVETPVLKTASETGIVDESDVDFAKFIDEDDIEYKKTEYMKASVDTIVRTDYPDQARWSAEHLKKYTINTDAASADSYKVRSLWLRWDDVNDLLNDPEMEGWNLVDSNVRIYKGKGQASSGNYIVRYLPEQYDDEGNHTPWDNTTLTYNQSTGIYDKGKDVGNADWKTDNKNEVQLPIELPATGLAAIVNKDTTALSVSVRIKEVDGQAFSVDMIGLDTTTENNRGYEIADTERPSIQFVYSNATSGQLDYMANADTVKTRLQEIVDYYDNKSLSSNMNLPAGTEKVAVNFEMSENKWASIEGGKLKITRPTSEEGDQVLKLKVTCSAGVAKFSYNLTLMLVAEQEISGSNAVSLSNLIAFTKEALEEQEEKDNISDSATATAGQLDQDAVGEMYALIEESEAAIASEDLGLQGQLINEMIDAIYDVFSSGKIDNTIVFESKNPYMDYGNTLLYSKYRAKLDGLVMQAKALLLVDEDMYPVSAKIAMQEEIDRAELALARDKDGKSKMTFPFTKTRMFHASFDDSMIQLATYYPSQVVNFNMSSYGLEPMIGWYQTQHVLYESYVTTELEPTYAGYVHNSTSADPNKFYDAATNDFNYGKAENERIALLQFDLSDIRGFIKSAKVRLVSKNTNRYNANVYNEYDFDRDTLSFNKMVEVNGAYEEAGKGLVSGDLIGTFLSNGQDKISYFDITGTAVSEKEKDEPMTISFQQIVYGNPCSYYTAFATSDKSKHPCLEVISSEVSLNSLYTYVDKIIAQQAELIDNGVGYTDIKKAKVGAYEQTKLNAAKQALAQLRTLRAGSTDVYAIGEACADYLDAAYEMRMSIALSTDIEVDENSEATGNIFYSAEEIEHLKERIKTDDNMGAAYDAMKEELRSINLETTKDYWERWQANDITLWRENKAFATPGASTGDKYTTGRSIKNQNNKAIFEDFTDDQKETYAANGSKAYITLTLDSGDNDTTGYWSSDGKVGCGEVWIDNLQITPNTAENVEIPNASFETPALTNDRPAQWTCITEGNGIGKWDSNPANVSSGSKSLYFHNPDGTSKVVWQSDPFYMPYDTGYEIYYNIKQLGIFEECGVRLQVHLMVDENTVIDSKENFYNAKTKPSVTGVGGYNPTSQRAAVMAMLADNGKDKDYYAELAKLYLYLYLDEISQGIETWLTVNARPDGIDSYGAVQVGRGASGVGATYSILKYMKYSDGTPVFTEKEKEDLAEKVMYVMRDLADIRDRFTLTRAEVSAGAGNWQSDMATGGTLLALAFDNELPYAKQFFYSNMRQAESMLLVSIGEDGSWPESVRYHNSAVGKLAVVGKALRATTGIDWFADKDIKFYRAFEYLCQIQTPRYANGNASTPWFGDHTLTDGSELYMCGLYSDEVVDTYPELAARMKGTWENAGTPTPSLGGEDVQIQAFFGHEKDDQISKDLVQEEMAKITSTDYAKGFGTYIFRNNFMVSGKESYLAMQIQDKQTGHCHQDQLSFIMYADNIPLVVDPGASPSYWGANSGYYKNSYNHSTVVYSQDAGRTAYHNTPYSSNFTSYYSSDSLDTVRGWKYATTKLNEGEEHTREIAFIKNGFEAYVIWDQISGATYGTSFMLPLYTPEKNTFVADGNKYTAKMWSGINLDINILQGDVDSVKSERYDLNGNFKKNRDEDYPRYDLFEIQNQGNDDYLVVLFPQTNERGTLTTKEIVAGEVYQLIHSSGKSVYVAVNNTNKPKTFSIEGVSLTDLKSLNNATPIVYAAGAEITVPKYQMVVLSSEVTTTQDETNETDNSNNSASKPLPSMPGSTGGAAAGGGGVSATDGPVYVSGDNSKTDVSLPGVSNAPYAKETTVNGTFTLNVTIGNDAYYSINNGKYVKYTEPVTVSAGDTITYFTVNQISGLKTRAIQITVGDDYGSGVVTPSVKKTIKVTLGKKKKVKVLNAGGAKITYMSGNKKVVKVSKKGKLTPVKKGKAKVAIKVTLGEKTYKLKTTVKVTK